MDSRIEELSMGKMIRYSFYQDEKINKMISSLSAILSLSVRQSDSPTTARYVREVLLKSEDDTKDCNTNGITVLTRNRVVVTVFDTNNNVKLIDMGSKNITSCLSLSSKSFDVTETEPNQVAVALGNERKIEILTVSDVLTRSRTICTPGALIVDIRCNGSNFITACQNPGSFKIIDMSGITLNTFTIDNNSKDLFTMPRYIAISRDKNVIYVTDFQANTVTSMTTGGHVISVYKHDMLKYPLGVAVDKDGTVYVCSQDTHTVHQLSPTGDLARIVLRQDQGLPSSPKAIAYSDKDHRLYISSNVELSEKVFIRLYQLE